MRRLRKPCSVLADLGQNFLSDLRGQDLYPLIRLLNYFSCTAILKISRGFNLIGNSLEADVVLVSDGCPCRCPVSKLGRHY